MKRLNSVLVLTALLINSCYLQHGMPQPLHEFIDISPDDRKIAYTCCDSLGSDILEYTIENKSSSQLIRGNGRLLFQPRYSPDGSMLLYLVRTREIGNLPQIAVYTFENKKTTLLETNGVYPTEAVFSPDGASIYFFGMVLYKYASLSSKPNYSVDIYKGDFRSNHFKRITGYKSAGLHGLVFMPGKPTILTQIETFDQSLSGLVEIDVTGKGSPSPFSARFSSGTSIGPYFSSYPTLTTNGLLITASPRKIVATDILTREAHSLRSPDSSFVYSPRSFKYSNRIAFTIDSLVQVPGARPRIARRHLALLDMQSGHFERIGVCN